LLSVLGDFGILVWLVNLDVKWILF